MENHNLPQTNEVALHKRQFKPFWPIVFIAVVSALVGVALVWAFFNQGLDEELNGLVPGKFIVHKKQAASSQSELKDWQTYTNKEYGFSFKYPNDWKFDQSTSNDQKGFFVSKNSTSFAVLPRGEYDFGVPFQEPKSENVTIDNKRAVKKIWAA